jgi:predicted tellurium resistance membrane protein TerC
MGIASSLVAKLLNRFKWIGWIGVAIIVYVAIDMIWNGSVDLWRLYGGYIA